MKKQLISTLLVASALSFASAQTVTTTAAQPVLPLPVVTGDTRIDGQVRALNAEFEAKFKALREEYQVKLKALIGNRKAFIASSTKQLKEERKELKEERKDRMETLRDERQEKREEIRGTSTPKIKILNNRGATTTRANPQGNAWGFLMKFFGQAKVTTSTQ